MRKIGLCIVGALLIAAMNAGACAGCIVNEPVVFPETLQVSLTEGSSSPPIASPTDPNDDDNTTVVEFSPEYIETLRNETRKCSVEFNFDDFAQSNVILCPNNLNDALLPYHHIRLQEGYRIEGYWVYDGLAAYIIPFVVHSDVSLPDPTITVDILFSSDVPLPPDADTNITRYVEGDDSPDSYLETSIFLRELHALNAWWHALIGWPQQTILANPEKPQVAMNSTHATVTIYTEELYCGYRTVTRYVDTYSRGNYEITENKTIISEEEDASAPGCF